MQSGGCPLAVRRSKPRCLLSRQCVSSDGPSQICVSRLRLAVVADCARWRHSFDSVDREALQFCRRLSAALGIGREGKIRRKTTRCALAAASPSRRLLTRLDSCEGISTASLTLYAACIRRPRRCHASFSLASYAAQCLSSVQSLLYEGPNLSCLSHRLSPSSWKSEWWTPFPWARSSGCRARTRSS